MKTQPSQLIYKENIVIKKYTLDKYIKNFKSELEVLSTFKSEYCIKIWDITHNGYTMEKLDFSLGNGKGINEKNIRRILFSLSISDLLLMLDNIGSDLLRYGIEHRDFNPGNILWSEKDCTLKVIDFFWSRIKNKDVYIPSYANPLYGQNDIEAIKKIKKDINVVFEKMKLEIETAKKLFEKIGIGEYKDGSSSSPGRAYHIVDIPEFRNIPYSKDACIKEYSIIKNNLQIKPKSFIDIGCADGYFTFNLLRDFNIKYAKAFERDILPLEFLKYIKLIYRLNEVEFTDTVDDNSIIDKVDIAIFLNSHMWIYKQLGKERTLKVVRNIISKTKYMFFQTAAGYSKGRYRVEEYKTKLDIKQMLYDAGAKDVKHISTNIGIHNAPRDMFMVKG